MLKFKIDVLQALKDRGITSYRIRKDKIISEDTQTAIRNNIVKFNAKTLDILCCVLELQPGDILEYVPDISENKSDTDWLFTAWNNHAVFLFSVWSVYHTA